MLDESELDADLDALLACLAEDVALFDQRGCLSPRVVLVNASADFARDVAKGLAAQLERLQTRVPRGRLEASELAEITAYRDTASFAGELFSAGLGFVGLGEDASFLMPPIGRNVHVLRTADAHKSLSSLRPMITSCAFAGGAEQRGALCAFLPGARVCDIGDMQSPPFDGPVDRREL